MMYNKYVSISKETTAVANQYKTGGFVRFDGSSYVPRGTSFAHACFYYVVRSSALRASSLAACCGTGIVVKTNFNIND